MTGRTGLQSQRHVSWHLAHRIISLKTDWLSKRPIFYINHMWLAPSANLLWTQIKSVSLGIRLATSQRRANFMLYPPTQKQLACLKASSTFGKTCTHGYSLLVKLARLWEVASLMPSDTLFICVQSKFTEGAAQITYLWVTHSETNWFQNIILYAFLIKHKRWTTFHAPAECWGTGIEQIRSSSKRFTGAQKPWWLVPQTNKVNDKLGPYHFDRYLC